MFGKHFMYIKRDNNKQIYVKIPVLVKHDIERRYLVEQPQRMFTTGLLLNSFAINTTRYTSINNECFVIGQIAKTPELAVVTLLNYINVNDVVERDEILASVLAMLSSVDMAKMSEYVYRTSKKHTKNQLKDIENSIYNKLYRMLPSDESNTETSTVNVDYFHLKVLQPMNYNVKSDVEVWQAVNHCVRCGLYITRVLHNVQHMNNALLKRLILSILQISQQTLGLIGR